MSTVYNNYSNIIVYDCKRVFYFVTAYYYIDLLTRVVKNNEFIRCEHLLRVA